jgi:hypothetical protein
MLPDYKHRNELRFHVAGIPYNARLALVAGLWATGLIVQAALGWILPGAAVILVGTILALTRGYSNEPPGRLQGEKRWETATLERFERIAQLDAESRRWDRSAWIDATNPWGCLTGLLLLAAVFVASASLGTVSVQLAATCALDGAALFAPFWLTGIRRYFHRTELTIRVGALQDIVNRVSGKSASGLTAMPMLELQKTTGGDIPQDVKLIVQFSDAPENFLGIQVQVSLNNVQGTKYPYLYCVILAKPGFGLKEWNVHALARGDKITTEYKKTAEIELIVVRQTTTQKSGYHTNRSAQIRVFDAALEICRRNLSPQS